MTPVLGVSAAVVDHDRLLLIRRARGWAPGLWCVPGGKVELGETLAEAVTRELREETGLDGVCGPMLFRAEIIEPDVHFVILCFEVTLVTDIDPVAGGDAAEVRWVDLPDVAELHLVDGLAELLHDAGIIPTFT